MWELTQNMHLAQQQMHLIQLGPNSIVFISPWHLWKVTLRYICTYAYTYTSTEARAGERYLCHIRTHIHTHTQARTHLCDVILCNHLGCWCRFFGICIQMYVVLWFRRVKSRAKKRCWLCVCACMYVRVSPVQTMRREECIALVYLNVGVRFECQFSALK